MMVQAPETTDAALERAERTLILEALAHLRYRTHPWNPLCPGCFSIEKILNDYGLAQTPPPDTLPT
jgi:hypothetical protein